MTMPMVYNDRSQEREADNRIWRLQYGPCWCHSTPTESSSFDYVRLRRTSADLGALEENLLIVSERVIDGSAKVFREVYASVPEPKLVVSAGTCPSARAFWNDLPNGWVPVQEILSVDIPITECVSGNPEALVAGILGHLFSRELQESGTHRDKGPDTLALGSTRKIRNA